MRFYDREKELALVREALAGDFAMVVVYGRRRVGKTRLVREALKGTPHLDIFIPRKRSKQALEHFRARLTETEGFSPSFASVDEFLRYLVLKVDKPIFLDEIGNLQVMDPSAFSTLQQLIDEHKEERPIRLVVSGSYVGLMRRIFAGRKEPMFGRATHLLELPPLPMPVAVQMIMDRGFQFEDAVGVWGIVGGVPRYIETAGGDDLEGYVRAITSPGSFLVSEGENTLIQEFGRKWETYFAILEGMGQGVTRPNEIAQTTGINPLALPKYLAELEGLDLVERSRPVLGKERYVQYQIKDNFYRFWFRFIYPNIEELRGGYESRVDMEQVSAHMGRMAERFVAELIRTRRPFEFEELGPWWSRKGDEIDLIARTKSSAVFIEVKWGRRKVGFSEVEELIGTATLVERARNLERRYLMVSRSSFTPSCLKRMDEEGIMHWDLEDLKMLVRGRE
jgi:AAA+ ATPase superfamily predicted ATPase